ncbi:hypothetical protein [Gimesia aquarii]|uniref:Uncharacterized protein n=1 Tax=Gimesia aquarii TaxID=2527964 RepID=A0A517W1S9_9PLAN|nr:hypothetical protein [Gimesia aquarii]QDT99225.1 hypothetical protein V144x_47360 [Gimesia aquarii]
MKATIEAGLSGTGPIPIHIHMGRPTPWSEGFVVRFESETGPSWIGNLQTGYGYATKFIEWNIANVIFVIAEGASYFIRPGNPEDWKFFDDLGIDCIITPRGNIALLSTYSDIIAISMNGVEQWRRTVAIDGVEIKIVENGLIYGNACIDPPDVWNQFVLQLHSGNDAK